MVFNQELYFDARIIRGDSNKVIFFPNTINVMVYIYKRFSTLGFGVAKYCDNS